jgi:hypothetical protein
MLQNCRCFLCGRAHNQTPLGRRQTEQFRLPVPSGLPSDSQYPGGLHAIHVVKDKVNIHRRISPTKDQIRSGFGWLENLGRATVVRHKKRAVSGAVLLRLTSEPKPPGLTDYVAVRSARCAAGTETSCVQTVANSSRGRLTRLDGPFSESRVIRSPFRSHGTAEPLEVPLSTEGHSRD